MYEHDSKTGLRICCRLTFPNIMTGVDPFDPNVEPPESSAVHKISLSLDQSIL